MRHAWLGLVAGLAAALVIACGAGPMRSSPAPTSAVGGRPSDLHAQIDELDHDIGLRLHSDAVDRPTGEESAAAMPITMDTAAKVCTPPAQPRDQCAQACTLGDAICDDATRICALADQLPGDDWAANKCAGGKASCERARQRCCDCT